jgi:uncharacterized protein YbjT (DUF2867 family)
MGAHTVAIAGATGFVGRSLIEALLKKHTVIGITRGNLPSKCTITPGARCPVEWRRCDLYSLRSTENALQNVETAVYLVHSMLPSAKLTQGSFQDMDLLMADNFARAAKKNGVKHIVYLGGFVPPDRPLSRHLKSRLEVETILGAHGIPVTTLRAGIIIGPGGSSSQMITDLVRRMPIIPCPRLAESQIQPIALSDVIEILTHVIENEDNKHRVFDIGGPSVLSYKALVQVAAQVMNLRRHFIPAPLVGPFLCKQFLSLCTSAPYKLTSPLVESLNHNMVQRDYSLQESMGHKPLSVEKSIQIAVSEAPETHKHRCCLPNPTWKKHFTKQRVRSVQRIPLPPGKSVQWLANEYGKFHHTLFRFFVRGTLDAQGNTIVRLRFLGLPLLELSFDLSHSHTDRAFYFVTGGFLVQTRTHNPLGLKPRLEFRRVLSGDFVIVALHDFVPSLPWPLYISTQAFAHIAFMWLFSKKMQRLSKEPSKFRRA